LTSGRSPYSDEAAAFTYERLAGPIEFAPPARDLVALMDLEPGSVVLDVGTGTGAAAEAVLRVLGPAGRVVGVDPSVEMLRASRIRSSYLRVAGAVPHLPIPQQSVDAVIASFVVTHLGDFRKGLADMIRTCRPGGRLGVSAWGTLHSAPAQVWDEVASRHMPAEDMQREFRLHLPSEAVFAEAAGVRRALQDAGLASIVVATRVYVVNMPAAEFLEVREISVPGTILRGALDRARWEAFRDDVRAAFLDRFGSHVTYDRDVTFGVGTRDGS
jgi:trans-aconitate methyltransferase